MCSLLYQSYSSLFYLPQKCPFHRVNTLYVCVDLISQIRISHFLHPCDPYSTQKAPFRLVRYSSFSFFSMIP
nr:MAG TPA: hypothetical protein [Caudoviricetes sp.]